MFLKKTLASTIALALVWAAPGGALREASAMMRANVGAAAKAPAVVPSQVGAGFSRMSLGSTARLSPMNLTPAGVMAGAGALNLLAVQSAAVAPSAILPAARTRAVSAAEIAGAGASAAKVTQRLAENPSLQILQKKGSDVSPADRAAALGRFYHNSAAGSSLGTAVMGSETGLRRSRLASSDRIGEGAEFAGRNFGADGVGARDPGGSHGMGGRAQDREAPPTEDNIEGPFYRPDAPFTTKLSGPHERADVLVISGRLLGSDGRPIADALVDVWQADSQGGYDIANPADAENPDIPYRFRGRMKTDAEGNYRYETVIPGQYAIGPGRWRPAHIHYKVSAPGYQSLTTQLYFKGDRFNETDSWWKPSLEIDLRDRSVEGRASGKEGAFDIVLAPRPAAITFPQAKKAARNFGRLFAKKIVEFQRANSQTDMQDVFGPPVDFSEIRTRPLLSLHHWVFFYASISIDLTTGDLYITPPASRGPYHRLVPPADARVIGAFTPAQVRELQNIIHRQLLS